MVHLCKHSTAHKVIYTRGAQPQHCWHFVAGYSLLSGAGGGSGGGLLCIVGCLAVSMASNHAIPVASPPQSWHVSRHRLMSPGGGHAASQLRTTDVQGCPVPCRDTPACMGVIAPPRYLQPGCLLTSDCAEPAVKNLECHISMLYFMGYLRRIQGELVSVWFPLCADFKTKPSIDYTVYNLLCNL